MRIGSPEWLLLIPIFGLAGWYLRHLELWKPLRVSALLLLVLALTDLQWQTLKPGVDLILLLDRSDSARALVADRESEIVKILKDSRGPSDQLRIVDFAGNAMLREGVETIDAVGGRSATRLDLALRYAASIRDAERKTRVLALTDGYSTAPVAAISELMREESIDVYYRNFNDLPQADVSVERLEIPTQTQLGAPFLVEFLMDGPVGESVSYQLMRNDDLIKEGRVEIEAGGSWVRLTDRLITPGAFEYTVRVLATDDPKPGNNQSSSWVAVDTGPRLLLVSAYTDDPLRTLLGAQGFIIDHVVDYAQLNAGSLNGVKTVIVNNVPANKIPDRFLKELQGFVTVQGGGLIMYGGKYAFGSGGYYQSPLDAVLPVSMEMREDQRRLATAMAIVMDRSGSMGAVVEGGRTKMDLANAGAAGTVRLLGPMDSIAVFAVDSLAHEVVPMTLISNRQEMISNQVLHIESMGGGIFVYTGLKAAWEQLKDVKVGQQHIILFSDSADSEEPGQYKVLLQEMRDEGATVSVIGLGSDGDADADFLKDIAERGGGRMFFNSNPNDLPRVFAQETVAVARSTFVEEITQVVPTNGWSHISPKPLDWLPVVDGYNLSYLKEGAIAAAFSGDEYNAPLVAYKRFGAGRSAAVTFPLVGPASGSVRGWNQAADLAQTLTRWVVGEAMPEGIGMRTQMDGSLMKLELFYDDSHSELFAENAPRVRMTHTDAKEPEDLIWRRIQPGHLMAETQLDYGKTYKGAVQLGDLVLPFGPIVTNHNEEWLRRPERLSELAAMARITGGGQVAQLEDLWESGRVRRYASLRSIVLILLLVTCLAEFLWSRYNP
ncbi:MAG: VWA domain-containing protein [Opitutales bacterium]